jgi:asparagine synthase (glutamine-hydrolysing)
MCGIAGYIGPRPPDNAAAGLCLRLMRHRGPDDTGSYRHAFADDWQVCLLFARLSIIDLDPRSSQPMRRDGRSLVFNGELYNYLELRGELAKAGQTFTTTGDAEVLHAGLVSGGAAWLDRAEGMWALALYDERDGVLRLCRDRFGEKPLYLMAGDGGWYFGSEVKFLAALAGRRPAVNTDHLLRYLVNGYKSLYKSDETFHIGVRELAPSTIMTIAPRRPAREERYWTPAPVQDKAMTFDRAAAEVRERLIESVRLRLRADVPIAFCMSGGVDSNTLISIAKRVFGYDVHGFTVMNADARYEEQGVVDAVVGELGVRHTAMPLARSRFLENLRHLVAHHDAPIHTISYYIHWQLMGLIADHGYKISVSGTAADELFTGYFDHHNAYLAEVADDSELYAASLANWKTHVAPVVRNPFLKDPNLFRDGRHQCDHIYLDADVFSECLTKPWNESFHERHYTTGILRNRMLNELFHECVPVILHEDDLNAMSYSIENRSPFLDRRLVELANAIPTRHLVRNGYAKAVLREAMRGIVPDVVIDNHRKVGFNAPIEDLLPLDDPSCREELLEDSPIYDLVRRDAMADLLDKRGLSNSRSKFLFNVISAKMFLETERGWTGVARSADASA